MDVLNENESLMNQEPKRKGWVRSLVQWLDSDYPQQSWEQISAQPDRPDLVRCLPFFFLHLGCLGVLWVGWSWTAVWVATLLYLVRMFAITAFYHRYFSHRTFKAGRLRQFLFALLGASAAQRGPLWWAYQHRNHHRHSDEEEDVHSPWQWGFWWSHIGWITSGRNFPTDYRKVKDWARFPELRFLNRFDLLVPALLALGLWVTGFSLARYFPALGTNGWQLLVWGFFISTTVLFHATSSINSLAHLFGSRRFATKDHSRNNFLLSLVTLGEGWHNNHHRFMSAAVWSAPAEKMRAFPAVSLLRFFHNHGFLGMHTQHPWRTVEGGSRQYVEKLTRPFADRIQRGVGVQRVRRCTGGVKLRTSATEELLFDRVIFACHADQALVMLADPSPLEVRLLSAFRYQPNVAVLHTDASVMPARRRTWASWNYRVAPAVKPGARHASTHYWMNSLQNLASQTPYFVSINPAPGINPGKVLWTKAYHHPLFDVTAMKAQDELPLLNRLGEQQSTFFCGSYFRYGFHEDALLSGYEVAKRLLNRDPWLFYSSALPGRFTGPAEPALTRQGEDRT
ncbi:MAG: fatty acid desaturase [Opitutales bacterium]